MKKDPKKETEFEEYSRLRATPVQIQRGFVIEEISAESTGILAEDLPKPIEFWD